MKGLSGFGKHVINYAVLCKNDKVPLITMWQKNKSRKPSNNLIAIFLCANATSVGEVVRAAPEIKVAALKNKYLTCCFE